MPAYICQTCGARIVLSGPKSPHALATIIRSHELSDRHRAASSDTHGTPRPAGAFLRCHRALSNAEHHAMTIGLRLARATASHVRRLARFPRGQRRG